MSLLAVNVFGDYGFEVAFWLFLSLFIAVSAAHLVFCFLMIPFWRKLTKPFCLLFLGAAMAFLVPNYPLVYVSCWLSAIGDVLLIKNKTPLYFTIGAAVFAVAHTLNAVNQSHLLSYTVQWYVWLIFAAVVVAAGAIGYFTRGKTDVAIAIVGPSYACFHFLNIILAIFVLVDGGFVPYELMILFGYLVYVVSDLIVNYVTNKRDINRRDFYIMSTYLVGQTLIYFGLAFSLLM